MRCGPVESKSINQELSEKEHCTSHGANLKPGCPLRASQLPGLTNRVYPVGLSCLGARWVLATFLAMGKTDNTPLGLHG